MFPKNFLWGSATSAHQVEGQNINNDWWAWEQKKQSIEPSGKACKHYELFRQDFDLVKEIKQKISIPVIFSGNLTGFNSIQKTYGLTGVDGFMIGRALWGAPWKLKEIKDSIEGVDFYPAAGISQTTALSYATKHLDLNIKYYGSGGFNAFKKHCLEKNTDS